MRARVIAGLAALLGGAVALLVCVGRWRAESHADGLVVPAHRRLEKAPGEDATEPVEQGAPGKVKLLLWDYELMATFWLAHHADHWLDVTKEDPNWCPLVDECDVHLYAGQEIEGEIDGAVVMSGRPDRHRHRPRGQNAVVNKVKRWGRYLTEGNGNDRGGRFDFYVSYGRTAEVWELESCRDFRTLKKVIAERPPIPTPAADAIATDFLPHKRPKFLAVFVSDCTKDRLKAIDVLMEKFPGRVDSYGACRHNVEIEVTRSDTYYWETKRAVLQDYKFAFAFENHVEPDYITEKIFDAYIAGALPIYKGAQNVADGFVPDGPKEGERPNNSSITSMIRADDFESYEAMADHIAFLDENDDAYLSYFRHWDLDAYYQSEFGSNCAYTWMCRVCKYLDDRRAN